MDRLASLWSVQTVKLFHSSSKCMKCKNSLSPLNEMQFTDCQQTGNHYYSLSDCTDRNVALTDCISASILDNPPLKV